MKRGFTLIEVVITMALSVVMLVALTSLFRAFNATYAYQQAFTGTTDASGSVLRTIESAVRPANAVLTSHAFNAGTYTSGEESLVLELPATDASGSVLAGKHDYVAFYRSATTAYQLVEVDPASARRSGLSTIGREVVSLAFTYNDPSPALATLVSVDITASTTLRGEPVTSHLAETMRLRNR